MKILKGKLNIIMDGHLGSTGKGVFADYVARNNHIDIAITNCGPNAGHTYHDLYDRKRIVKHLPVSGIIHPRATIYLCAGAIINPEILRQEMIENEVYKDRVFIHPRACIVEKNDVREEKTNNEGVKKIASTMTGVGNALMRKISRTADLAYDETYQRIHPALKEAGFSSLNITKLDTHEFLKNECNILMEVPQGYGLSLNHGLAYPYCTSRDITVASAMNDANVHPKYLGNVGVCLRTFPIRVGNVFEDGKQVGYSGPFWKDSKETSWDELNLPPEFTTRTNRVRRVCTFSDVAYQDMLKCLCPDYIFLNFCNYLKQYEVDKMLRKYREITHVGFGPKSEDIKIVKR